ncbi:PilZ domain-containing protein [Thalassotalea sp. PLHSN55]|uniref:PilZ domain-containing protein n=1 Tax=Thalassotalea sp. PLHSN55 TaxID=3435888 RepID=UPI003F852A8D
MENRRQFTRILFSIEANVEIEERKYPVSILDISLNGALINTPESELPLINKLGVLSFNLNDQEEVVMHIAVVHQENGETGLRCNAIDIDSITSLRRLVELNLGDESQLNKELSQLTGASA